MGTAHEGCLQIGGSALIMNLTEPFDLDEVGRGRLMSPYRVCSMLT